MRDRDDDRYDMSRTDDSFYEDPARATAQEICNMLNNHNDGWVYSVGDDGEVDSKPASSFVSPLLVEEEDG